MQKAEFYIPFSSATAIRCANRFRNPLMSLPRAATNRLCLERAALPKIIAPPGGDARFLEPWS